MFSLRAESGYSGGLKASIIHAVFPSRRGLLPSVRALLDFLAIEYAAISRAALPSCARR